MSEFLISVAFAISFTLLALIFKGSGKNKQVGECVLATITNLSDHDGRVNYYVTVEANGRVLNGKSVSYPSSGKSYKVGDIVPVTYNSTKNEWIRVYIQDDELTPSRHSANFLPKVLLGAAITFWFVAIFYGMRLFV